MFLLCNFLTRAIVVLRNDKQLICLLHFLIGSDLFPILCAATEIHREDSSGTMTCYKCAHLLVFSFVAFFLFSYAFNYTGSRTEAEVFIVVFLPVYFSTEHVLTLLNSFFM